LGIDLKIERQIGGIRKALGKFSQTTYMDNQLKEFEEFLLDNALLKV
jgi:hypothetical protein